MKDYRGCELHIGGTCVVQLPSHIYNKLTAAIIIAINDDENYIYVKVNTNNLPFSTSYNSWEFKISAEDIFLNIEPELKAAYDNGFRDGQDNIVNRLLI